MEGYQTVFFVATVTWFAVVVYIAYLHRRISRLEKKLRG